ncbi:M15 family metallopeptidase [Actinoplanes sp. NPDC026670]|uniref:M15 family metallopeptidase n=1 Tax=Actinoplanes sp. NPDC026670 TaxID=3154700 RepID=UPI003400336E
MAKSQNGWSAGTASQIGGLDNSYIPGTKIKFPPGVRKGDVAVVLFYVAERFHKTVEPLRPGWNWGHNYRVIRGATALSNHASGTAIDLNAPEHPLGKANTFSAKQVKAIRVILAFCEGVVRWGGDYKGRKDDMHFEIVKNAAAVKKVADKIRKLRAPKPPAAPAPAPSKPSIPAKPAPAPAKPAPAKPAKLKEDGVLGATTIKRWQQVMGTKADGKIDSPSELVKDVQRHLNAKVKAKLVVDGKGIAQNSKATKTIKALQRYLGVKADGKLDKPTSATVKALQKRLNSGKF